jgi:hypothetical protein
MIDTYLVKANNFNASDVYLFPIGTDKNHLIDCLEYFCKLHRYNRSQTYEFIGDVLNSNCFSQTYDKALGKCFEPSLQEIEIYA